jgi:hypothetical protein
MKSIFEFSGHLEDNMAYEGSILYISPKITAVTKPE